MLPDITSIVIATGYIGITAVITLESGTPFGLVLPGDSLLFTAGFLASQHLLSLPLLLSLAIPAAFIGELIGYHVGRVLGPRLFTNERSRLFNPKYLLQAQLFFEQYGSRAIFLGRFIPVVRCFITIVAGVGNMRYSAFLAYNALGAVVWAAGIVLLGFWLGRAIPNAEHYLFPIVLGIIVISFIPALWHIMREKRKSTSTERQ